jgi:hypothetical protein
VVDDLLVRFFFPGLVTVISFLFKIYDVWVVIFFITFS